MCQECFEDYKDRVVFNDRVVTAQALVERIYHYHAAGGYGHVVFDDFNIEDGNVRSCLDDARANSSPDHIGEDCRILCIAALELFMLMNEDERASTLGFANKWI